MILYRGELHDDSELSGLLGRLEGDCLAALAGEPITPELVVSACDSLARDIAQGQFDHLLSPFLEAFSIPRSQLEAELGGEKYPLVLANIVADVIIPLSAWVPQVLSQDGVFLCSGIIAPRAQEVADALARNGLKVTKKREKNGWAALEAVLA